ncbi:ARHGDIA family protein [Megaselia abdita]
MDKNNVENIGDEHHENEDYVPPPQKTIEELVAADQDDESLRRYKETLLGMAHQDKIVFDASNPKSVIVKKLSLLVDSRPEMELDLSDVDSLKKQVITIKEGIQYKVKIDFIVQREIVHGLKYVQKTSRIGVPGEIIIFYFK